MAGHGSHAALGGVEKLPTGHVGAHAAAPTAETLPPVHATHKYEVEPDATETVPAGHTEHANEDAMVPGGHGGGPHDDAPADENSPGAHAVQPAPLPPLNVPAGHEVHEPDPGSDEKSPGPHAVQSPPAVL